MANMSTEGGSVHPGKPVIWPTGKQSSTTATESSNQVQTPGQAKNVPARGSPNKPSEVAPTQTTQPSTPTAVPTKPTPTVARPLTVEDIRSHLLSLEVEPNDFNAKLASLMLRNGLELSRTNFVKMMSMLQGTNKSPALQEAALLLVMKGLDSPQAVKVLGQYFSDNPGLASQFLALQEGLGNLTTALGMGKALLDVNLVGQLNALLSQFDETLKNIFKNSADKGVVRQNILNDVRALKALLAGVQEKTPEAETKEAQALSSSMMEFQGKLDGVVQNLLAQALLSQSGRSEVNYLYQQIPNAMTTPPKDFEIVVKRDGEGKDSAVDPRNTHVVMSLSTENVGKLVVSMYVKDNKVYVVFVFAEKDYGDQGRALIAREFGDLQQKLAKNNYMVTGYQVKVDPAMCQIKPYLIPMLPKLEDILKKIDIEA